MLSVFVQMLGLDDAEAPVVGAYFDVVGNLLVALLISMTIQCRWRKAANQAAFLLDDMV